MSESKLCITPSFVSGAGTMRDRCRSHDWAGSPLGEPGSWPRPLRTVADIILDANQPMFVAWGPDQAMLYNDGYAEILGSHHPAALGRPFFEVWSELVDSVGPIMARGYAGEPTSMDDIELVMNRKGYEEETHFSFFYAPIRDEAGGVGGVFCACHETTQQVVSQRERREAEALNRQILDSAVDYAIVATDLDGLVTRWNEGARRIFGWDDQEILGETIDLIFTSDDRANGRPWIEMRAAAETGVGDDERWHVRKSGERFWASGEMTPLRNEAGRFVGFVKVLRDRTEQRLADRRLVESETRFRSLTEATPGFVWMADRNGDLTYTSARWHDYSGTEPGQSDGDRWVSFVHPEDRESAFSTWAACLNSGDLYETEFRLRAADGGYRWWLARALPTRDEAGSITFWAGVCTDIESIVAARQALSRSREDLETQVAERTHDRDRMWRLSRDMMLVARIDGTVTAVNPASTALLGWSEEDLLGRDVMTLVHPDDVAPARAAMEGLASGRTVLSFEVRCRHKDSGYRWLTWTAVPDDGLIHAIGRDITADKVNAEALARAEDALRQSQKMEAVGQLTGGIAHDFNNLLTGITGSLELLEKRLGQGRIDSVERYVTTAKEAATRAAALTHRLLGLFTTSDARSEAHRRQRDWSAAMGELIERTVGPEIMFETILASDVWMTLV